jgi:Golgi SNAP receptor complex protein 1
MSLSLSASSSRWEELGREARSLERDIDSKLVAYSKLGSSARSLSYARDDVESGATDPLLDEHTRKCRALESELEDLLDRLSSVHSQMVSTSQPSSSSSTGNNSSSGGGGGGVSMVVAHTLQRHREILHEYTQEFRKYKSSIAQSREHAALLSSVKRDLSSQKAGVGLSGGRADSLLRERTAAHDADRVLSDSIASAMSIRESLSGQRNMFDRISGRVGELRTRFPSVDQLMGRIAKKKRRDMVVLGLLIATLIIITVLFMNR